MNVLYAKALLYAYVNLDDVAKQIDELVERKAKSSFSNYKPAISQFESIIKLTYEKDIIYAVKIVCDKVLSRFNKEELDYFRYKYFKNMSKKEITFFDSTSRSYFRRQIKLAEVFAEQVEKLGIDDEFFEQKCMLVEFFRQHLKRAEEHERLQRKNKSKKVVEKL